MRPVPGRPSVARPPRGPTVYQAPRWPIDRLGPRLLRFTRMPGTSERRRVNRRGTSLDDLRLGLSAAPSINRAGGVRVSAARPCRSAPPSRRSSGSAGVCQWQQLPTRSVEPAVCVGQICQLRPRSCGRRSTQPAWRHYLPLRSKICRTVPPMRAATHDATLFAWQRYWLEASLGEYFLARWRKDRQRKHHRLRRCPLQHGQSILRTNLKL
jgi:hypothetical protein